MKFYLGIEPSELYRGHTFYHVLISYFSFRNNYDKRKKAVEALPDVFLDSGAYSAYTRKKTLDVQPYIEFIQEYQFKTYAALDVVYDAEKTRKNFEKMLAAGLNPIPTFHYGSDIKVLQHYLNYPYIALGGLVTSGLTGKKLQDWLDYCFKYLIKPIREKGLKVHGFGLTRNNVFERYPFYSSDSTSWKSGYRWGRGFELKLTQFKGRDYRVKPFKDNLQTSINLCQMNIDATKELEDIITKLWAERGIIFND